MPGHYNPLRYGPSSVFDPLLQLPLSQPLSCAQAAQQQEHNSSSTCSLSPKARVRSDMGTVVRSGASGHRSSVSIRNKVRIDSSRHKGAGAAMGGWTASSMWTNNNTRPLRRRALAKKIEQDSPPPVSPPAPTPVTTTPLPRGRPRTPEQGIAAVACTSGVSKAATALGNDHRLSQSAAAAAATTTASSCRRRSVSWHHRERLRSRAEFNTRSSAFGVSSERKAVARPPHGGCVHEATVASVREGTAVAVAAVVLSTKEGNECRDEEKGVGAVETGMKKIDAEELFRRKKKFTYHVTFSGWAKSYDKSKAERALLERNRRAEAARQDDLQRRRAAEEFQKWLSSHNGRPTATVGPAPGETAERGFATGSTAKKGVEHGGAESEDLAAAAKETGEVNNIASPQRVGTIARSSGGGGGGGGCGRNASHQHTHGRLERTGDRKSRGNDGGEERGMGREYKRPSQRERDRAFRKWLDCKKKQATIERQAERQKQRLLEERRKLEASRRWKKRPVVCAYTYGARVDARRWSPPREKKMHSEATGFVVKKTA